MVVTPDVRPLDPNVPISPMLSATRTPQSPALSASLSGGPMRPVMRKASTGSFSKLADFWLDGTPSVPGTPMEPPSTVKGIPHVELSIDAR